MEAAPLEAGLPRQADKLVGRADAFLVVDDTRLPKKGTHSVGVAPQYASMLGKRANRQTLVSLTLARHEDPVAVGLRLFLPESWTSDAARTEKAAVPKPFRRALTKPAIALEEIDRLIAQGVRFGAPFSPMQATVCPLRPARAKRARGFGDAEPDGAASEGLSAQLALVVGALPNIRKSIPPAFP